MHAFPSPGDLPNPGTEATSPVSPALQADSVPAEPPGKLILRLTILNYIVKRKSCCLHIPLRELPHTVSIEVEARGMNP